MNFLTFFIKNCVDNFFMQNEHKFFNINIDDEISTRCDVIEVGNWAKASQN